MRWSGLRRLQSAEVHEAVQGPGPRPCRSSAAARRCDDALLKSFGDEAIGLAISGSGYTADLDTPSNKQFIAGMVARLRRHSRASTPPASTSTAWSPRRRWRRPAARPTTRKRSSRRCGQCQPHRHAARAVPLRPSRQRRRQHLHPPLRAQGRQARQHDDQDLPERQPVLDLRREVVPGAAGLLARLSAAQGLIGRRRPHVNRSAHEPLAAGGQQRRRSAACCSCSPPASR